MTRTLDQEIVAGVVTTITGDALHIELHRLPDLSVNPFLSNLRAVQHLRDSDGNILGSRVETLQLRDWPEELKEKVSDLRDYLRQLQEVRGKLPSGTDKDDF